MVYLFMYLISFCMFFLGDGDRVLNRISIVFDEVYIFWGYGEYFKEGDKMIILDSVKGEGEDGAFYEGDR